MEIFYRGTLIDTVDSFIWKGDNGYYLCRLMGVNVTPRLDGRVEVAPVYIPLFQLRREAGQLVFDWYGWRTIMRSIVIQGVPPYIKTAVFDLTPQKESEDAD